MNSDCRSLEELTQFVYGPLSPPEEEKRMVDHVIVCLNCRAQVMSLLRNRNDPRERRRGEDRRRINLGRPEGECRKGDRRVRLAGLR
ncbi:MAG TPA: hypothetical protein VGK99_03605 [Acidobacteriota bacterium]